MRNGAGQFAVRFDLTGQRFGQLVVLARVEGDRKRWLCRCDCGREARVLTSRLRIGHTKSCGCRITSDAFRASQARGATKHGHGANGRETLTYRSWHAMINRCYSPGVADYPRYGGAGVTVCDRWRESFLNFLSDMGERPSSKHSLDRIDNARGYEPGNCRWASEIVQGRNKRSTKLTAEQVRDIIARARAGQELQRDIAREYGITQGHVSALKRGVVWPDQQPSAA